MVIIIISVYDTRDVLTGPVAYAGISTSLTLCTYVLTYGTCATSQNKIEVNPIQKANHCLTFVIHSPNASFTQPEPIGSVSSGGQLSLVKLDMFIASGSSN